MAKLKSSIKGGINPKLKDPAAKKVILTNKPKGLQKPPPGTYDPNLDAQERAAQRGYGYLTQDTEQANQRATTDYGTTKGLLQRGLDRGNQDIATALGRENANYQQQTQDLGRSYTRLGESQAQQANAAGVAGGGALMAALAKRQANQQHDQAGLDTQHNRAVEDLNQQQARLGEDYGPTDPNAAGFSLGRFGQAASDYLRGTVDRGTQQQRAGTELGFFQQDTNAQRGYQAAQAGYVPPKPKPRPRVSVRPRNRNPRLIAR